MTTPHTVFQFVGGDDWEIHATLLDENGNPYNLTGATITWTLLNSAGQHILNPGDFSISIINATAGTCKIVVLAAKTTTIPGGRYTDALRILIGGVTSTLSIGPVQITRDPWAVSVPVTLKLVA
jgi:hypothetical protein